MRLLSWDISSNFREEKEGQCFFLEGLRCRTILVTTLKWLHNNMRKGKNRPYIHSFWGSNPFGLLTWNKRRKMALKKVVAMAFEGQRNITSIKLQMARNLSVDARGRAKRAPRSCPWNMQKVPRGFIPKHTKAARIWAVASKASRSSYYWCFLERKKICILSCHNFFKTVQNTSDDLELEKSLVHRARLSFQGKGLFLWFLVNFEHSLRP